MPKKGRLPVDPIKTIADNGFIGYVEEEHNADEPGVIWVDIEVIHDNPYQHAEVVDKEDFQTLVASIEADGFLGALNVSPLPNKEGHYYLNGGGHQRRDAARAAGLSKLPVFVTEELTDRSILAFRVARENTTRVNTSMINLGHLYQQMIDEFNLTQEEIAKRIGKDRNHVKFALTAARSAPDIQEMLRQRPDSLRAMTYFRRLENAEDRKPIMDRFLRGELSTEGVRQEVELVLASQREEIIESSPTNLPGETTDASHDHEEAEPLTQGVQALDDATMPIPLSVPPRTQAEKPITIKPLTRTPVPDKNDDEEQFSPDNLEHTFREVDEMLVSTMQFILNSVAIESMTPEQLNIVLKFSTRWQVTATQLIERIHAQASKV